MSVFISLASYCDPLLQFTVGRALATASAPADLHFGIVDQSPERAAGFGPSAAPARLSYVRIDPMDARGPCWARALAMSFYDGEDWFFQLDSHMDFDPDWDAQLIAQARLLLPGRLGVAISAYPNPFTLQDGRVARQICTEGVLAHVVKPGSSFDAGHLVLPFEAHPVDSAAAVPGFHLGAGCLFAPGRMVDHFPYDPHFYFHGEEQALALRLFTHGWDIFHMARLPVYHLYNNAASGAPRRPLHWDPEQDAQRSETWWSREQRSRQRLTALVGGELRGVFGLGTQRTVADYAAFSGIDYGRRELAPQAHRPLAG
ncbi:MAG: hypothetical protein NVS3B2_11100 [Ramlibacter sp.]